MTDIKLSVCIATYNRAAFIGDTLESIASQCPEGVEVVILDGGSPDNTTQVVSEYQRRFPFVRYFRQDVKNGVDADFCRAVELANGEYCWLMSDDDLLKAGAIDRVLKAIAQDYNLIIVNAEVRNADLSALLEASRLGFSSDRVYDAAQSENFFRDTAGFLSFIGCVVIKKSIWDKREKEKYFGTVFVHVGVIFQEPIPGKTLVIATPMISIRFGNAQWSSKGFEIWMFKWPDLIWSFPVFSDAAKSAVCLREPWRKITPLLVLRAVGVFSAADYEKWLMPRAKNFLVRAVMVAIAFAPRRVMNLAALFYFSFLHYSPLDLIELKRSPFYWRKIFS